MCVTVSHINMYNDVTYDYITIGKKLYIRTPCNQIKRKYTTDTDQNYIPIMIEIFYLILRKEGKDKRSSLTHQNHG